MARSRLHPTGGVGSNQYQTTARTAADADLAKARAAATKMFPSGVSVSLAPAATDPESLVEADGDAVDTVTAGQAATRAQFTACAADPRPEVRRATASHPDCPSKIVDELVFDRDQTVACTAAGSPRLSRGAAYRAASFGAPPVREALCGNPTLPVKIARMLSEESDPRSPRHRRLAANASLPDKFHLEQAKAGRAHTEYASPSNTATPPGVLDYLAKRYLPEPKKRNRGKKTALQFGTASDSLLRTRKAVLDGVSAHPNTPTPTLVAMAAHRDCPPLLLRSLAGREDCPIFEQLARHDDEQVRAAIASNRSCPERLLDRMSGDHARAVRAAVANNPAAPDHIQVAAAMHP